MKIHTYSIRALSLLCTIGLSAKTVDHDFINKEAKKHYTQGNYKEAVPLFAKLIEESVKRTKSEKNKKKKKELEDETELNRVRIAQSILAIAIEHNTSEEKLRDLMEMFDVKHIALGHDGLGDVVQAAGILKKINAERRKKGLPDIELHLPGFLWLLKDIMIRSGVSAKVTSSRHDGEPDLSKATHVSKLFNLKTKDPSPKTFEPYLVPSEDFKPQGKNSFAICWRSGTAPVYGGRRLHRDFKVKNLIDAILQEMPDAHFYSVQGPPHRIILQSEYDKMSPEDKKKHALDVVPDSYAKHFTNIKDKKPFEDTLNVLDKCIQIGCDTVNQHIAVNLPNGKTIMIIPASSKDGTSNRDWRWSKDKDTSAWYPKDKMRIFEIDTNDPKNFAPAIAILKEWLKKHNR